MANTYPLGPELDGAKCVATVELDPPTACGKPATQVLDIFMPINVAVTMCADHLAPSDEVVRG